jgi:hypothetical protein
MLRVVVVHHQTTAKYSTASITYTNPVHRQQQPSMCTDAAQLKYFDRQRLRHHIACSIMSRQSCVGSQAANKHHEGRDETTVCMVVTKTGACCSRRWLANSKSFDQSTEVAGRTSPRARHSLTSMRKQTPRAAGKIRKLTTGHHRATGDSTQRAPTGGPTDMHAKPVAERCEKGPPAGAPATG